MPRLVALFLVAVVIGLVAAFAAWVISHLTSATVSPLGAVVIGLAFGLTSGNVGGRRTASGRTLGADVLRGLIAGATAGLAILLLQRP